MGEVSRFLANVVTFGAVQRVDDAMSSYRSVVSKYNTYVDDIKKLHGDIQSLQNEAMNYGQFIKSNEKIIFAILKDEAVCKKLTDEELYNLKTYSVNLPIIPPMVIKGAAELSSYEDDTCSDLALCTVTTALPIIGIFAAHGIASEDIEKINLEKQKIILEIAKLTKSMETLTAYKYQLEKKLAVQKNVHKLILWYKKEYHGN